MVFLFEIVGVTRGCDRTKGTRERLDGERHPDLTLSITVIILTGRKKFISRSSHTIPTL